MPLPLPIIPMTLEQYHSMDHRLGWKHEYWDGAARLFCQPTAVASFELPLQSIDPSSPERIEGHKIRNIIVEDTSALVDLFVHAFEDAVEYAGWEDAHYLCDATQSIESVFGKHDAGEYHRADGLLKHSFLVHSGNSLVAAILVRNKKQGPVVEPIMVELASQRLGIGKALLVTTIQSLCASGVEKLYSRCHLGNFASFDWHQQNGFIEVPDYFNANHRWRHFQQRVEYYRSREQTEEAAEMLSLAECWSGVARGLEPGSRLAHNIPGED